MTGTMAARKITHINSVPISQAEEMLLVGAITLAHEALTTHRLSTTIETLESAPAVIDACNEELFKRLVQAESTNAAS